MIKKTAIATAVALITGAASIHAADMSSGTFNMRSPGGTLVGSFADVTGTYDSIAGTWNVASPSPFFGVNWTAHDGVLLAPGTYTIPTIEGGTFTGIVVGPDQVGGHILFDYGPTKNIDVINVWDEVCIPQATFLECTYTTTDGPAGNPPNPDGIPGYGMLDGAFPSWNAAFDFVVPLPLPGAPTFTTPANVIIPDETSVTATPATVRVSLGTVIDESPVTAIVEYSTDGLPVTDTGKVWIPDDGSSNTIDLNLTETVNNLVVDWRAVDVGGTTTSTQNVQVIIKDLTSPIITGTPGDAVVDVTSTVESVCFAGTNTPWGMLTADDAIEPNVTIEYSLNNFDFTTADTVSNCSNQFGPNANTVYWRASDKAVIDGVSTPNVATHQQTVTLNLPTGIVGKPCTVDLSHVGTRQLEGAFIMRDPTGGLVGDRDDTVTGEIDTTELCIDSTHGVCTFDSTKLKTDQAFQGLLWIADPIHLFGVGDWTFETCPDDPNDNSINCDKPDTTLNLTVLSAADNINNPGIEQLGAHMLFAWGNTEAIDVAVAWDVDCGAAQLTTTDPDGDGILGTRMVDGPFEGFNAAFDVSATGVDLSGNAVPLIADGGYTVTIPTYRNPVKGASPLPLTHTVLSANELPADDEMVSNCNAGGCFEFETDGVIAASDNNGNYQFVQVVLPLSGPTPWYSLYRVIMDPVNGNWQTFIPDARNEVKSAPLNEDGSCPEPGAGDYRAADANSNLDYMLQPDDQCIQLTIEDNGIYDSDDRTGFVKDPSGIAVTTVAQPRPDADTTGDGGCSITGKDISPLQRSEWGLLAGLLVILGFFRRHRYRKQS